MQHVLTLIADERSNTISPDIITRALSLLIEPSEPVWLNPGYVCDIQFTATQQAEIEKLDRYLREIIAGQSIDLAIQPKDSRRKQLLIADMDSTIIEQECIDELGAQLGLRDKIAEITERAMRGELDFEAALKERVAHIQGLEEKVIDQILAERITLTPGAKTLVQTMAGLGAKTALVSGGFTAFADVIGAKCGFDHVQANVLLAQDGILTGKVQEPILGQDAKRTALLDLCADAGISHQHAVAVGDGANDLAMIQQAGLGVAFHAKPQVAAAAHVRIDFSDLTSLLYLQGIEKTAFAQ